MTELRPAPDAIRTTYRWLAHAAHGVTEVRVIRPGQGIVGIGFFDDEHAFVRECARANTAGNVYAGIQPRPRRLLERAPNEIRSLRQGASATDIQVVTATVIDIDPDRAANTASTDDELATALGAAEHAAGWCQEQGLVPPARIMSGNGAQLWFAVPPIQLTGENRATVQANLRAFEADLRQRFQSGQVKVDSIHDLARIIKVVGTVSLKGSPTQERPHRLSACLDGPDRREDPRLRELLLRIPHLTRDAVPPAHPILAAGVTAQARRTADGELDWSCPVEMCRPVARLWSHGCEDRSLAIFNMVRFLMHKGLGLDEITDLVIEYDARKLGKLDGRDGPSYVRQCYEKVAPSAGMDGAIAPPCRSLQELGFCQVNREPGARCELYGPVLGIEEAVEAIPRDLPPGKLEERLKPVIQDIARHDPSVRGLYLDLLAERFGLKVGDLRSAVRRAAGRGRGTGASPTERRNLRGEVLEAPDHYFVRGPENEHEVISSFRIEPTERIILDAGEIIVGSVRTDRGRVYENVRFPPSAWHSKRGFIQSFPNADMQWTGSDDNVQGLLRILSRREVPVRTGLEVVGYVDTAAGPRWVTPSQVLGSEGPVTGSELVLLDHDTGFGEVLHYPIVDDATCRALACQVLPDLLALNEQAVVLPVLGWFFATPFKPRLMQLIKRFPILWIWGTRGSGKTSLVKEVFWRLFGVRAAEQLDSFSVTQTKFALIRLLSATNSIPVFLDEYRPDDMSPRELNTIHRLLRSVYGGEVERRGRANLSVSPYRLAAPVCVGGEGRPDDAALVDRLVSVTPNLNALTSTPLFQQAFYRLQAVDLTLLAAAYVRFALGRDTRSDFASVALTADQLLVEVPGSDNISLRCRDNLRVVVFGLFMFAQFAAHMGVTGLPELDVQTALAASIADLMDGEQGAKSPLDLFVETCSVLAYNRALEEDRQWAVVDGLACLHLRSCWEVYLEHQRKVGQPVDTGAMRPLRRMLRENLERGGYVKDVSKVVSLGNRRVRTVALDLRQASVFLDVDGFPEGTNRTWGGPRNPDALVAGGSNIT